MITKPTKLTPELIAKAKEYVEKRSWMGEMMIPTAAGLATHLGIHKDSLYEYVKINTEISDVMKTLKDAQEEKLLQKSLVNQYNPTIAKLLLSSKHGYVEKSAVDNTIRMPKPILGGISVQTDDSAKEDSETK